MAHEAADFLLQLRPGGPWVLTAIDPETVAIATVTVATAAEAIEFVARHDGNRNLYYSVNPTIAPMTKKATKADIAAIEYLQADLDPRGIETPEEAKARYLTSIGEYPNKATVVVDSGNGIQGLWRLDPRVELDGEDREAKIAEVEERVGELIKALGGTAETRNVDRIFRLPGTTNIPTAAKKAKGRVACPAKLIQFNGVAHKLEDFPWVKVEAERVRGPADGFDGLERIEPDDPRLSALDAKWIALGRDGTGIAETYGGDRSRAVMAFACECLRTGNRRRRRRILLDALEDRRARPRPGQPVASPQACPVSVEGISPRF
jgi:hypothetical protein